MNLTNEQIRAILDGAPKGVRGYNIEESHEGYSYYFVSILDLDLLRETLTLRQEVERLKAQQSEVAARAVESSLDWLNDNYPNACQPACGLLQHYASQLREQSK